MVTVTPPTVAQAPARDDACPEPNDDPSQACNLGTDSPALGYISTPSDTDFYSFQVSGARSWVHVELTDLPADFDLEIQDANHDLVASSSNSGPFPEVLDVDLDPGKYLVGVYSSLAQSSNDKPYKLGLSMVPLDSGARPAASVLFADNFNSRGAHFAESSADDGYEVGYYDGEYVVKLQGAGKSRAIEEEGQMGNTDLQDFQLDLDARTTGLAQANGGFTVSFRWQNGENQYELYVDTVNQGGPGVAQLVKWQDGKLNDLTGWVPSGAIKTGSQPNHVTIRAQGDQLTVAINGQQVLDLREGSFKSGDIGLGTFTGDRPTEARFDNVIATPPR